MCLFCAFLAGLVFGFGLIVSGMASPSKVLGFLDLAGRWDPSLALVMAGAIAVGAVGFTVAVRRPLTLLHTPMLMPTPGERHYKDPAGDELAAAPIGDQRTFADGRREIALVDAIAAAGAIDPGVGGAMEELTARPASALLAAATGKLRATAVARRVRASSTACAGLVVA
jgi:uncharacterized membrane protein YedE/YeeE